MNKRNWLQSLRKYAFMVFLIMTTLVVEAQDTIKQLVLQDAIKMAMDQNRQIRLGRNDEKIAQSKYKQTEGLWLPQVNLSYTAFATNQPLGAFGFKLQQAKVQQSDFGPAILNKPGGSTNTLMQLSVQQALYNPGLTYMRKAAAKQTEMYVFQTQRTQDAVAMQVTNTYLQLEFSYEAVNVLDDALKTIRDIDRFTNDRYEQGLLQKSDLLNVQVQVKAAETNLAEARSQIKAISDQLGILTNSIQDVVYKTVPVNMESAGFLDSVPANRSDVKSMQMAIASVDLSIMSVKMSMFPKINAFANYQFNDKKLFGFGANGYMAGLKVSWDIFNGNLCKYKITTQVLEKRKIQEQLEINMAQDVVEIRRSIHQLADIGYRISKQSLAVESASESHRIIQNRYNQGLVNTTDVLTSQTQLVQQKMLYAQAIYTKKAIIAYLNFLTAAK